jgi:hypothetical protein
MATERAPDAGSRSQDLPPESIVRQCRDEFLFEARRELHLAVRTIETHLKAVEGFGSAFHPDSAGVVKAKAAMLAWSLDQATKAMSHILELANQTAARLASMPQPEPPPVPRRPVPETD